MSDENQVHLPQPEETPAVQPDLIPGVPRKSNNNVLWIVGGLAGIIACLCCVVCLALVATAAGKVFVERAPVEAVLKSFMADMEARNTEAAYELFSPRSKRTTPITDLEKMLEGKNYVLFEGYENLSVQNLNISAAANTDPNQPQGMVAEVNGTVSYEDGTTGRFTAVLEKVDGQWKLFNINITVPPDKFNT